MTDILTAEQQAQKELEEALALAEEANQTREQFPFLHEYSMTSVLP